MPRRPLVSLALLIALLAGLLAWPQGALAGPGRPEDVPPTRPPFGARFFPETQHNALNSFLETWNRTPDALAVLGYPISEPFIEESFSEPGSFYRVQYFERAVLEEHPENYGTPFYILGRLLGTRLAQGRADAAFQPAPDPGNGTWDAQSQHTLANSPAPFRTFWQRSGGLETFGRPISEQFQEVNSQDGQTYWVQYFERQRMEWHPGAARPVQLGLLGNEERDRSHAGNPAFAPAQPAAVEPVAQQPSGDFAYGFNAILYGQGSGWQDRRRVLELAKGAGMPWIRQQVRWMDLHGAPGSECANVCWGELDNIVRDASDAGVKLLLSVVAAPSWATPNGRNGMPARERLGDFSFFMGEMAARFRGHVQAYEIWNEQNLAHENAGRVASADLYMDMLVGASQAIKAADPAALVVSGAPSSTETNVPTIALSDLTFLRQMFADPRFRDHVDIVGVHPGGAANPPDSLWPDRPGPGPGWVNSREFYFRRVEDARRVMVESGLGDKQMWITEFGWATRNNTPGYGYGNRISFQRQAEYIVRAFQMGRNEYSPWLTGMFLWQLNFAVPWKYNGNELHEQASFGVLNGDWSPRPAYEAIKAMPK
jgi:hypothetical protein